MMEKSEVRHIVDTHTLLVGQDRLSGPLLLTTIIEDSLAPLTVGAVNGQILGVTIVIALGAYMTFEL